MDRLGMTVPKGSEQNRGGGAKFTFHFINEVKDGTHCSDLL